MIFISQVSTATISDETVNQNRNFLTASLTLDQKYNTGGLAFKLNRLKEKSVRYARNAAHLNRHPNLQSKQQI